MSLSSQFSAAVFALNCKPKLQRQFIANHPFVFVIKNTVIGIVLFVGRLSRVYILQVNTVHCDVFVFYLSSKNFIVG
jgi:hypothetical protein